jgi:phage terminase large subunit
MDFNVNPITAVVYVRNRTGLHAIDEIVIHGSNTDEMVEEIRTRYSQSRVTVYPDPAGVQRKTSAGGRTDISILQNAGFSVLFKRQHPRIRDRVNAINALMKNVSGEYRYTIDPKCKNLIESYEKLTYKEGTQVIDKDSGYDHMFDAATYAVDYLFPVTDQRPKPEKPKNWQMQVA